MRRSGNYHRDILTRFSVTIGPPHCRPRASHAGGTQEWRDAERPPRVMRYLDEPYPEGSGADQPCMSTQPQIVLSSAPRPMPTPMRRRGLHPQNVPWLIYMLVIGRRQVLQTGRSICEGKQCMSRLLEGPVVTSADSHRSNTSAYQTRL